MSKFSIFFILLLTLCSLFFAAVPSARALTVAPALIEVEAERGEELIQKIQLFNETNRTVTIFPSLENFQPGKNNLPEYLGDNDPLGAARWITLPVQKAEISAGGLKELFLTIKIPEIAEPGGRYAALFWTEQPAGGGIGAVSRLATIFLFRVGGEIREEAEILSFEKIAGAGARFAVDMENGGNVHLRPGGFLSVKNWLGREIESIAVNPLGQTILPQSRRRFEIIWAKPRVWLPALYSAQISLFYGGENKELAGQEVKFLLWPERPWALAGGTLAILFLSAAIIKIARKKSYYGGK